MWKWLPKKGTEISEMYANHNHVTTTRQVSTSDKPNPISRPIWLNRLPTPEILPPGGYMMIRNEPGCGAGFRQGATGSYLDTGTYF